MRLIAIDFETYFDSGYTLKKYTTESYVRDLRFKVHCMGIKKRSAPAVAISSGQFIKLPEDTFSNCAVLCHHAQFDGLIMNHHYGWKPAMWFDTLSMARLALPHLKSHSLESLAEHFGLSAKTVPYNEFKGVHNLPPELYNKLAEGCKHDVDLTYSIFTKILPSVPPEELRVIDATIRMFTEPVLELDKPRMEAYLKQTRDGKIAALDSLGITKAELQSSAKFAARIETLGVAVPTKQTLKGNTVFAIAKTDEGMKQLLESENETVVALAAARLDFKSTIGETRAERLLSMASRGALCCYLKYWGAHTGRWAGGDSLNFQNLSRGSELRKCLIAPLGHQLVIIDLAQIECRLLNWLAGEGSILTAFREGRDLYSEGASRFYGRPVTKENKLERHLGKTLELGCGYGMGWTKFQYTCRGGALGGAPIELTEDEAKRAVASYRASHPAVVRLWKQADRILDTLSISHGRATWGPMKITQQRVVLPGGACLDYSNLTVADGEYATTTRKGTTKIYGAKLVENVVQALSRVVLSQAMLKIIARGWRVVLTVHDELVMVVPDAQVERCLVEGLEIMKTAPVWADGLPLDAEGFTSREYSK